MVPTRSSLTTGLLRCGVDSGGALHSFPSGGSRLLRELRALRRGHPLEADAGALAGSGLPAPSVGEVGTIRRVIISAPNDGDDTFLMFYVKFPTWGATTILHESEFV